MSETSASSSAGKPAPSRLRRLWFLLVLLAAGGASYAAAASLPFVARSVGSGGVQVPICDSDGFKYTRTLDGSHNVTGVTVSDINAACVGGLLQLTLAGSGNAALGSGTGTVAGASLTVTISGTALASSITSYNVAITG
jgi:hypothetical protein